MESTNAMTAVNILALKRFESARLAALDNAMRAFGKVDARNIAYGDAVEAGLIQENGLAWDTEALKIALVYEVNRRVEEGVFR